MDKNSDDENNMSLDSLEENFKRATSIKEDVSEENVDTILVPFYEQDILIKVPKAQKTQVYGDKNKIWKNSNKSYLINKRTTQHPKNSYLQIFRKKNNPQQEHNNSEEHEIRSLSPEYGDTERESICEDVTCPTDEFINTESYNEIYYEKLMEKEYKQHLENSFGDEVHLNKDFDNTGRDKPDSVSETSLPRRVSHSPMRKPAVDIINNVKLGGLGPDMEKIKPRLERARSLQRYSEKVRLENRLKIYKKSLETEKDKRPEQLVSPKQHIKNEITKTDCEPKQSSYLVKRISKDKKSLQLLLKNNYGLKSACISKTDKNREKHMKDKDIYIGNVPQNKSVCKEIKPKSIKAGQKERAKEGAIEARARSASQNKAINRESRSVNTVPPVKISFTVNFEGVRPSSALKRLEAKHKMYQEKVKKFTVQKENL